MKTFTRIQPTTTQTVGDVYKRSAVIKRYQTEDGEQHEFTTFFSEELVSVLVVAVTTDNKIAMTYQFRAGPEKWLYDFPGGDGEPGEAVEMVARRELVEETGCTPGRFEYIGECYEGPYINIKIAVYLATDCVYNEDAIHLDEAESNQGAELRFVSAAELFAIARAGDLCVTGPFALLFDYLDNLRQEELS